MTPDPALAAAVAAAPDDDLPRLVLADWLDDRGRPDHAEFVRAQVRLAATDPWEPFAVLCRHRRPEWATGDPWRDTLPRVDGTALEWHPDRAFRRGFGWALRVRDVRWLLAEAPRLFAEAPVGELHLPTATLDEWKAFARADWLPRVKAVHFYSTTTPIEPVRELVASPLATGIEEIVFEKSSGAGLPVLLEDLFASPLGRQLRRLELRVGPDQPDAIYEVLLNAGFPRLTHLGLVTFLAPPFDWSDLYSEVRGLTSLELANLPGSEPPLPGELPALTQFRAAGCGWETYAQYHGDADRYRSLDLSDNPLGDWPGAEPLADGARDGLPGLRSLAVRRTQLAADSLRVYLTRAAFWPNLVELDLRDNRITDAGAEHLLAAPLPPDLTALLLAGNPISDGMWDRLRGHFGDALVV